MHKDDDLVLLACADLLHDLVVADFVHDLEALDGLLLRDANELLLEGARTICGVEEEESRFRIDAQEACDVLVVRERGGEPDEADDLLSLFHVAYGAGDDALEHGTAFVVQQMDLVDYDEADEVGVAAVGSLASDDIPFLRGGDDDLGFGDLLFGQLPVARELRDVDSIGFEAGPKVADHLLDEGLHGGNVHNLERVQVDIVRSFVAVLADFVQNGEHGDVCLSGAGGRAQ
ncbi:hypothetical protein BC938DRAFT_471207 [Jimgerdemannia flammicorona]|uniref:Uncharacterized protein n=1 Tax=Jimgerdemannia flammicorona TaxID=994334 RepID=A0A433Q8I0_9FUNG|nr:hypothetical protein BC938DRAFT_471207 [Jimgerdemannia flammicorona]